MPTLRSKPIHPKLIATASAASIAGLIVEDLQLRGIHLTVPEASLVVLVVGIVAGYFKRAE